MRLRACSLLLLFMSLFIAAKAEDSPSSKLVSDASSHVTYSVLKITVTPNAEKVCMPSDEPEQSEPNKAKNVLIYNPYLGHHHIRFMTTIANQLLAEGHKVRMLNSQAMTKPKALKRTIDRIFKPVLVEQRGTAAEIEKNQDIGLKPFWDDQSSTDRARGFFNFYKLDLSFAPMMSSQCSAVLEEAIPTLKETKFDLAITEVFDFCGLGIFHILNTTKIILASSVPLHEHIGELLGLPKAFDFVPTKFNVRTMDALRNIFKEFDFRGFIENAFGSALSGQTMFGYLEADETKVFEEYYKKNGLGEFPGIKKLLKNAHSLVENVHPLLDFNKPTLNSIIPIGGITVQDIHTHISEKDKTSLHKIEKEIEDAKLEQRKVVLVSFGTVMDNSTMTKKTKANIVKALKGVNEATFFWYIDDPNLETKLKDSNVKPHKWLPQEQLLASGKVDLFVSHMGIGSMTEAAYGGVPFVSIPLFVDQHYNYVCAKRLGIAKFVDKASLAKSPSVLIAAIREALKDGTMKKKSTRLKDRLDTFGNQTKKMIDHINFILSLDENDPSLAFEHHHHGVSLSQSLRSLFHLAPYYAVPLTIISLCLALFVLTSCLCWCTKSCACKRSEEEKDSKKGEKKENDSSPSDWERFLGALKQRSFLVTIYLPVFCYYIYFGFIYPFVLYLADYFCPKCGLNCLIISLVVSFLVAIFILSVLSLYGTTWPCDVAHVIFWFTLNILVVFAAVSFALYVHLFIVHEHNW